MRILFVYTKPSYDMRDPLGLLYIISAAKQKKHNCQLLIYNLEKRFFEKAVKFNPDIVCYSVTTGTEKEYLRINSRLKEKRSFFSVFGGPHPTFYPNFIEQNGVDSICRGEAEGPFKEFLDKLETGQDIYNISNFWFKHAGKIISNELSPLVEELDTLFFPDRELMDRYWDYRKYGRMDMITGRGCPFNCSYCFNHKLKEYYKGKGKYTRKRSVDNLISELELNLEKYKIKEIYFVDDLFVVDKGWLTEFAKNYREKIGLPYICNIRADVFTEEMAKCLKDSNCRLVGFAIESGNYDLRKRILNRDMTDKQIHKTCEMLKRYRIKFGTGNMVGLPYETIDNAFETINLNIKCRTSYAWASLLQPYPNTALYDFAVKNNLLKENYSIRSDYHTSSPFKSKYNNELENLHNFFAICVDFPILIPFLKYLIRLPYNKFFKIIHNIYKMVSYIKIKQIRPAYPIIKNAIVACYVKAYRQVIGAK